MIIALHQQLRTRLALWYVCIIGLILAFYVALVFAFQYASIKRQIFHDEIQDVETVEGLFTFTPTGQLQLQQGYFSHPRSHLLIDRLMEVRDLSGNVLYRSESLAGQALGGPSLPGEGEDTFDERAEYLADGTHILMISHTHPVQGRMLLIRLGYSLAPFWGRMRDFLGVLLVAVPATLVLAGLVSYFITKRALRPLDQMATKAAMITSSNLDLRLAVETSDDELGRIAVSFNHLLERLEQAFAQLQRFTADVAHEFRTPLASIRSVGELALSSDEPLSPSSREAFSSMLEETAALNQTIEDLLLLARAETAHPGAAQVTFSLPELVGEVLGVLGVLFEERTLTVEQRGDDLPALVHADRGLIRAAIMNVLHNAVKFSPAHSTIGLVHRLAPDDLTIVELVIQDEGPGVEEEERDLVFQRFFTGAARGMSSASGSGIGLSIAKLAIERNGGEIFFAPSTTKGAQCVIRLPLAK